MTFATFLDGTLFLKCVNMSITAGYLVLAIIVLRLLLKQAPKKITVFLWAGVGIRLILPVSLQSILSLIPSTTTIPDDFRMTRRIQSGIAGLNEAVNPVIDELLGYNIKKEFNPMPVFLSVVSIIWFLGILAMLLYMVISYSRIYKKVREATPLKDNIFLCDHISAPFLLGAIRPRIYLPSSMSEQDMEYVIAHENAHLKRLDYWWKPLGFLLLTVYWFQPLLWIAYVLFCRDIELACDEKAIRQLGTESKKPYSDALINCSVPRNAIAAYPLGFGEVGIKNRIKSVLQYKKPASWAVAASIVVCAVAACCFLTDPPRIIVPKEPPELIVFLDGSKILLSSGQYHWEYEEDAGMMNGIFADSIHPLEFIDRTQPVFLPADYTSGSPSSITMQFEIEPDSIIVYYHDLDLCVGEHAWEIYENIEEELRPSGNTLNLLDGNYLYEIKANWGSAGKYYGEAYYIFYTEKLTK